MNDSKFTTALDKVEQRIIKLQEQKFYGKINICISMKSGGIVDIKFCPEENIIL